MFDSVGFDLYNRAKRNIFANDTDFCSSHQYLWAHLCKIRTTKSISDQTVMEMLRGVNTYAHQCY